MDKKRNYTIDSIRFIAVFFVVAIHVTSRLESADSFAAYGWYRPILDLGVPVFFAISGYFLAKKDVDKMKRYAFNLFKMLIAYSSLYIVYDFLFTFLKETFFSSPFENGLNNYFSSIFSVIGNIDISGVFNGTFGKYHLWFLMSLAIASLILYALRKWQLSPEAIFMISAIIYVIADLEAISQTGLLQYGGFPKGFLYVSMGYYIQNKEVKDSLIGLIGSFLLFLIANYFTSSWGATVVMMTASTYFLMVFAKKHHGNENILSKLGKNYSKHIYLIHPLVISLYGHAEELFNTTFISNIYLETIVVIILAAILPILLYKPIEHLFTSRVDGFLSRIF